MNVHIHKNMTYGSCCDSPNHMALISMLISELESKIIVQQLSVYP